MKLKAELCKVKIDFQNFYKICKRSWVANDDQFHLAFIQSIRVEFFAQRNERKKIIYMKSKHLLI